MESLQPAVNPAPAVSDTGTKVRPKESTFLGHIFNYFGLCNNSLRSTAGKAAIIGLSILVGVVPVVILGTDYLFNANTKARQVDKFKGSFDKKFIDSCKKFYEGRSDYQGINNYKRYKAEDYHNFIILRVNIIKAFRENLDPEGGLNRDKFVNEIIEILKSETNTWVDENDKILKDIEELLNDLYPDSKTDVLTKNVDKLKKIKEEYDGTCDNWGFVNLFKTDNLFDHTHNERLFGKALSNSYNFNTGEINYEELNANLKKMNFISNPPVELEEISKFVKKMQTLEDISSIKKYF